MYQNRLKWKHCNLYTSYNVRPLIRYGTELSTPNLRMCDRDVVQDVPRSIYIINIQIIPI